jgi:protein ImuB
MRVHLALYLYRLPLEVLRPQWLSDAGGPGFVVLDQGAVLIADAAASRAGVRAGLRRGGVLALTADAVLSERDLIKEQAALREVALALMRFSPAVMPYGEDAILMEVGASLRLFGGLRALCRKVRQVLDELGYSACLGVAPTGQGAWLLARGGGARVLKQASLARALALLPMQLVSEVEPFLDWFDGLGCTTIADLRRLPRAGLKRRCGAHLLDSLDRAFGEAAEVFEWMVAPAEFDVRIELPERVGHVDAALFAAHRLVLQLCGWLCARQLAVTALDLLLEHERVRHVVPPTRLEIAFGAPVWHEAYLMRLIRERMNRLDRDAAPNKGMADDAQSIVAVRLLTRQVQPAMPIPDDLFPEPGGTAADHARLLEILTVRLGRENVLYAAPLADYRPEVANRWQSEAAVTGNASDVPLPRPVWLLDQPLRLPVREHRPWHGSPLRMVSPVERIEAGWFDEGLVTRDYYVAQDNEQACYWIYRERIASGGPEAEPRWFLHGLFG